MSDGHKLVDVWGRAPDRVCHCVVDERVAPLMRELWRLKVFIEEFQVEPDSTAKLTIFDFDHVQDLIRLAEQGCGLEFHEGAVRSSVTIPIEDIPPTGRETRDLEAAWLRLCAA